MIKKAERCRRNKSCNLDDQIARIATDPHEGDVIYGEGFRLCVSFVTSDGIVVHTITTERATQTEQVTLKEWREAFKLES